MLRMMLFYSSQLAKNLLKNKLSSAKFFEKITPNSTTRYIQAKGHTDIFPGSAM